MAKQHRPAGRQLPIGEVGLSVIRGVARGDFIRQWETLGQEVNVPKGMELRSPQTKRRWLPIMGLVERGEVRHALNEVTIRTDRAVGHILAYVPELMQPCRAVLLDNTRVNTNRLGERFVSLVTSDQRPQNERDLILEALGDLAPGRRITWPTHPPSIAVAYAAPSVESAAVDAVEAAIASVMLPQPVDLKAVDIYPRY